MVVFNGLATEAITSFTLQEKNDLAHNILPRRGDQRHNVIKIYLMKYEFIPGCEGRTFQHKATMDS